MATLVLDLDNTLIFGDCKRPGVDEFMELMSKDYEIVVFTRNTKERADRIVNTILNAKHKYVSRCFYQDSCVGHCKPLQVLGLKDLKRVVMIDDDPRSYACNQDNALPISPFSSLTLEREEQEKNLLKLVPLLLQIASLEDVRPALKQWKEEAQREKEAAFLRARFGY